MENEINTDELVRKCSTCNRYKKGFNFHKNSLTKYGLHNVCKRCISKKQTHNKKYNKKNRDIILKEKNNKVKWIKNIKCKRCCIEKRTSDFHKSIRGKYGLHIYCKKCCKKEQKKYRDLKPKIKRKKVSLDNILKRKKEYDIIQSKHLTDKFIKRRLKGVIKYYITSDIIEIKRLQIQIHREIYKK